MNDLLLQSIHNVVNVVNFLFVSADEVTTIDNASWISCHIYVVQSWKRNPLLVCVEKIEVQGTTNNVFQFMLKALETLAGVNVEVLGAKFTSIGIDGYTDFQGSRTSVTTQMKETMVPFFMGVHCFAHRTNLVMFMLSKLSLVAQLEALFQAMYAFFFHSPKRYLEFQKLWEVFMEKRKKLFQNVKTIWINMLFLVQ